MRPESTVQATIFEVFCAARDRLRVAGDLAMAGWAAPDGEPGGRRSAPPGGARDRTAGVAGGDGSALALLKQQRQLSYEELPSHCGRSTRAPPRIRRLLRASTSGFRAN